jgi:hypothetical protein
VTVRNGVLWLLAGLGLAACQDELPPPGTPSGEIVAAEPAVAAASAEGQQQAVAPVPETGLLREVFNYRGAGRDPFASLLEEVRPFVEDLRVTAINYDPRYPGGSVAVLRDTTMQKRYTVRVGDEFGRLRVTAIGTDAVVLTIQDFGVERQMSLRLRGRQEETP